MKKLLTLDFLSSFSGFAPLPMRVVLGIIFFVHGSQKLFGAFGGSGFEGWTSFIGTLGLPGPAVVHAAMGAGGEFVGAILLFLGLFTRFGAVLIAGAMVVAITTVHWGDGLFGENGFQYPLTVLSACVALMFSGAGKVSVDCLLNRQAD